MGRPSATPRPQRRVAHNARVRIELQPRVGQTEASIQHDIAASHEFVSERYADADRFSAYYRWLGPVKFLLSKEVGPPPWRLPRVQLAASARKRAASVTVGWRSTAYSATAMWRRKPR